VGLLALTGMVVEVGVLEPGRSGRHPRPSARQVAAPPVPVAPARAGRYPRLPRAALYPFPPSPTQRAVRRHDLPPFWADGQRCSTGCRPAGAIAGWPLRPFHQQHPLRAGLNELRTSSLHEGLDIQTHGSRNVYAIQPGRAHIIQATGGEARVQVGDYIYWHVRVKVREGQPVTPYRTIVGTTIPSYGHLHLSELQGGVYLNPLRPGGRVLTPWHEHEPPVIGLPRIGSDGRVSVKAFDPQSFIRRTRYQTPVLAPAALGYQVFDTRGKKLVDMRWALRGTHGLAFGLAPLVYAPEASSPGFDCFEMQLACKPNWVYWLAGGLAPRLTQLALAPARYRLSAYAWDWAGNVSARDAWFELTRAGPRPVRAPSQHG
jgi:hypothetical protein